MATKNVIEKSHHHDLDFEKELWAAADKLRGNIDVSEYKNIVLGKDKDITAHHGEGNARRSKS